MDILSQSRQSTTNEISLGGYALLAKFPKTTLVNFQNTSKMVFTIWEMGGFKINKAQFFIRSSDSVRFLKMEKDSEISAFIYDNGDNYELYARCNNAGNILFITADFAQTPGYLIPENYRTFDVNISSLDQSKITHPSMYYTPLISHKDFEITNRAITKLMTIKFPSNYSGGIIEYDVAGLYSNDNGDNIRGKVMFKLRKDANPAKGHINLIYGTDRFKSQMNFFLTRDDDNTISIYVQLKSAYEKIHFIRTLYNIEKIEVKMDCETQVADMTGTTVIAQMV